MEVVVGEQDIAAPNPLRRKLVNILRAAERSSPAGRVSGIIRPRQRSVHVQRQELVNAANVQIVDRHTADLAQGALRRQAGRNVVLHTQVRVDPVHRGLDAAEA